MSTSHTVEQGEHLAQIAEKYEFLDERVIWDHPENSALKNLRKNPNVLFPGDRLFIPDKRPKNVPLPTTQVHWFRVHLPKLRLRLVVRDLDHRPIPNLACELDLDGTIAKVKTDANGLLDREIPRDLKAGFLRVSTLDLEIPVKVGNLDPVEEESGQRARLENLGYLAGEAGTSDDQAFRSAVEEFQCDHAPLRVDGIPGLKTQAELKRVHGC